MATSSTSFSTFVVEIFCPIVGTILANMSFLAPCASLRVAVARGSLGDLNPTPWALMTGNCIGWVAYSYLTSDLFVFFANCPGILLSMWMNMGAIKLQHMEHVTMNQRNGVESSKPPNRDDDEDEERFFSSSSISGNRQEIKVSLIILVWIIVSSIVGLNHQMDQNTKQTIVGMFVNANLMLFFGSPLTTIFSVIKTQNSCSIHRKTMIMNTAMGAFWYIYGLAIADAFIYIPNGIGVILGIVQANLCFRYPDYRVHETDNGRGINTHKAAYDEANQNDPIC